MTVINKIVVSLLAVILLAVSPAFADYNTGSYTVTDIWVDPVNGNDNNSGLSRSAALKNVSTAWNKIPQGTTLATTGYHIKLVAGDYRSNDVPNYWESRYGAYQYPVIIESVDGAATAIMPSMNIYDCRYLYILGLKLQDDGLGGDILHCEKCDHFLVRDATVTWIGTGERPQEGLKLNQSQYVYVEDSEFSGAGDNAIDGVAVQYGHFLRNEVHDSTQWCMYLKGGSSYFKVDGNIFYDCGEGGFTAGQGSGFEYLVSPWIHYEAYDIKFTNNIIHDIDGAGIGVNGGYNILMAYNTMYRVGQRSHVIEVVYGARSCDGDTTSCQRNLTLGGWGTATTGIEGEPIPDRNVYIYNNIVYNPTGYQSGYQHFAIHGPRTPSSTSNIPSPAKTDTNLRIRGNVIWNGSSSMPLGIETSDQGCQSDNTTCNATQLVADNAINTTQPEFISASGGDFRPVSGGNLFSATTYSIPDFTWDDAPTTPTAPPGDLGNSVTTDYAGSTRSATTPPGAYATSGGTSGCYATYSSGALTIPDFQSQTSKHWTLTMTYVTGSANPYKYSLTGATQITTSTCASPATYANSVLTVPHFQNQAGKLWTLYMSYVAGSANPYVYQLDSATAE